MDLTLIRELARLASVLELLKAQREVFSELSDIKEFRGLESDFSEALKVAQERRLVGQDPVSVVRADWQRMVRWSNRVQEALREVDELGQELSSGLAGQGAEGGRKRKKVQTDWKPNISQLRELEHALKGGPSQLTAVIEQARAEVQTEDWNGHRPYPELTEVAEAMGWGESLELAEPLGPWAEGVASRARPLVATRMATDPGSPMLQRRIESLRLKLSQVRSLQEKHASHRTTLEEVGRLTEAGQVETARRLIGTLQAAFGDLDYSAKEQRLAQLEKQLKSQSEKVAETKKELQEFGREAGRFFPFPPIGLMRRGSVAQGTAEQVLAETAQIGKVGGNSEVDRMVSGLAAGLKSDLNSLQTLWMSRVRRWILGTTVFWLVVFVAGGVTIQQVRDGQERERQRLAAEAKAAEEKALVEAKAKAEAMRARMASGGPFQAEAGERLVLGLAVRWIPAGRFTMGSPSSEEDRSSDETQHDVVLRHGFFMAETECTQGQWEMVMGSEPSHFKGANRPVEQVSWSDAVEYCRKLTVKQRGEGMLPEGWEWRLPTEAEWEYAARAGTMGPRYGKLDMIAWHGGNSWQETHPVSQKAANAWGLQDMMGNVWEWCSDWSGDYPTGSVTDPTGPSSGSVRVFRGGSWFFGPRDARSAGHSRGDPGIRFSNLGFRPALSSVR
jgi:formylglycine-generating enzyme required for sulfatase activity